ncbi:hypothetical protein [Streptomyces indicus]|uniref:Uncharacterized protein n=1 Tax=Streptomyces indicus TaxID=417292 RepID=A0A1G9J7J9_9ACTN|nr:hypothetical protein [Streptomyces indicus]SDL33510.1 hypothetical protein SAMN05421806_12833 [Streptomyces indicus]
MSTPDDEQCAHESWEVTGEHQSPAGFVKSRRCADCREHLDPVVEDEPHWGDAQQLAELPEGDVEYTVEARLQAGARRDRWAWVPMAFALRTPAAARTTRDAISASLSGAECRVLRWTSTAAVVDDAELDAAVPATVRPLADKAGR